MRGASMSSLKRYFMVIGLVVCSSWYTELKALSLEVEFVRNPSLEVFKEIVIHFTPDAPHRFDQVGVHALDNGRVMERRLELPKRLPQNGVLQLPSKITAHLKIHPIPKNDLEVRDKWDRAGNIRMVLEDNSEIELIKFVTAYGGVTEYVVDLTHLAAVLHGGRTIRAFIDTWVSPAWTIDLTFNYEWEERDPTRPIGDWISGLFYEPGFNRETEEDGGLNVQANVPEHLNRVMLYYYVSGHCTDGRGADEFESKDNVITVDGVVVHRYRPWRDDCRDFRAINPYCKRWSDGSWSSDYDRSGWCPGDVVDPLVLDLTDHLTPGDHKLNVQIDGVRPKDDEGHKGYWRVSAYLVGYR